MNIHWHWKDIPKYYKVKKNFFICKIMVKRKRYLLAESLVFPIVLSGIPMKILTES